MGKPFTGCAKYTGVGKICIFDRNRRLSRKRYEIGPWLLLNAYVMRKSYALYPTVIFSMIFTDPNPVIVGSFYPLWPGFQGHGIFEVKYLKMVRLWTKLLTYAYCRTLIGKHIQSIEGYHFQWPWLTPDLDQGRDILRHWISKKRH